MTLPESFITRFPESTDDFTKYYKLRFEALRKPWGQPLGSEYDPEDKSAIHAFTLVNEKAVAVCRLHYNSTLQAQIRYMAVDENYRGYGVGASIIAWMENIAKKEGASQIILHARENAVPFYLKQGYNQVEKSYLLFGKIQHFLMEKKLH